MRKIFLLILACLSMNAFAQSEGQVNFYDENKAGITVTKDQTEFKIKLKSNPTTGYTWFLRDYDSSLISPVGHEFEKPKATRMVGAPGYEIWTFKAKPEAFKVPQQTVVRLIYARPWDANDQGKLLVFRISTLSSQ